MAASLSGNRFPVLILLLLLLVSFLHVIRATRNTFAFSKTVRKPSTATVTTAQTTEEEPSFYLNDANGQHGRLYGSPPPPSPPPPRTHTPPPPPPPYKSQHKTNAPPPPPTTRQLPMNYNPFQYVTNIEDQNAYKTDIIESEKEDTLEDFEPDDLLEDEDAPPYKNEYKTKAPPNNNPFHYDDFPEEEDEAVAPPTYVNNNNQPPPPKTFLPASAYNKPTQGEGMSDTRFMENARYNYNPYEDKSTKLNNQDTTTYYHQKYNDQLDTEEDVDIQDVDDDDEGHH